MRQCIKCGKEKPEDEFGWQSSAKKLRSNKCRICRAAYARRHYLANKPQYFKLIRRHNKRRVAAARVFVYEYLYAHPCVDCGETDPVVLEFDHVRDKKYTVAAMSGRGFPISTIEAEIAKCEVRCANCHRRRTATERNWGILVFLRDKLGASVTQLVE